MPDSGSPDPAPPAVGRSTYSGVVPVQTTPATGTETGAEAEEDERLADAWITLVWNDPVNLMSYVFRSYFGYPAEKAERLMRQVHEQGRAVVSTGNREQMEVDVQAMHAYGLWATLLQGGA